MTYTLNWARKDKTDVPYTRASRINFFIVITFKNFHFKNRIFKRVAFIRIQWPARLWILGVVPSPTSGRSIGKLGSKINTGTWKILARAFADGLPGLNK